MDKHVLDVLELNKIKVEVQDFAATNIGKGIIGELEPVADIEYVTKRLTEVTAACQILDENGVPPFGGIRDLRQILKKVKKMIVLSSKELIDVRNTLASFTELKRYFDEIVANLDPRLIEKQLAIVIEEGQKIESLPQLEKEYDRCIDEYGEVRDKASDKLYRLRVEIDQIGNKTRDKMNDIVRSSKFSKMLQDSVVTRRGDRYVVPVKHEYRNIFSGIVHDQSASGLTLFMEPLAIVKMNNRLRELQKEEEKEVYKILQKLTGLTSENIDLIRENLKIATMLDVVFARAGYSKKIGGIAPEINDQGRVHIIQGRHPLLRDEAVPIDISVGENFNTLIITGPNTGGKTVALKTMGLFVLMVEIGLHIPCKNGTDMAIFKKVFADIGDEQSIEQNLSTFSSHIYRINNFLLKAGEDSLVLMDELGVGTDPREGAALGIAILEELHTRKVVTVATTHYSQLKSYAYSSDGVENASVEFDLETLRPTYRLLMGIPGGSNAFAIARRLGIPEKIVIQARGMISGKEIEIENIITGLNQDRKKYLELKDEYERKELDITAKIAKYENNIMEMNEEKERVLREAREEAEGLIKEARIRSKNIIRQLKKTEFDNRPEIDRMANEVNQRLKDMDNELLQYEKNEEILLQEKIEVGDQVRFKSVGRKGEVTAIDEEKNQVTVQAGIITLKANLDDLVKVGKPDNKEEVLRKYRVRKTGKVSYSLDLRGDRYENAQHKLDKYLDDAFLAGYKQVEIIHGKGTGALKDAVQEILEKNNNVTSFRLGRQEEGGAGVTIASF